MDNNNFILAIVLSLAILFGFQYFYLKPQQQHAQELAVAAKLATEAKPSNAADAVTDLRPRATVISESKRVPVVTPELNGSINLKGARLDDLLLTKYRETVADQSPDVTLLSPAGSLPPPGAYYAEFSWLADGPDVALPTSQSEWKADGAELSPGHPLKLSWDNAKGLSFERVIDVDDHFMFTVTDHVHNGSASNVTLYPFGLIARQGNPVIKSSNILHEGPVGVLDGVLREFDYKNLIEDGKKAQESTGGWLGITDKYWLVALAPPQDEKIAAEFAFNGTGQLDPNKGRFQADFRGAAVTLLPGGDTQHVIHLFAGAKLVHLLNVYGDTLNLPHFDRALDFGRLYWLTKPFLYLLDFLSRTLGSLGIAILVFTVMLKLITLPLSLKSYHSMSRMKKLQPEIKRIQEKYPDDKIKQHQETGELFKREKVNPMSGCLPTLIQIPIFFALYKILYIGIEMRQTPFYGWIRDMSAPDPTSVLSPLSNMMHFPLPLAMHIGFWPILMGCSMFLQQRLSPQPPDKSQARMFMFMPIVFTYMLAQMPAGLVIYWTWSNLLSIGQQWYIMGKDARRKTK